MTKFLSDDTLKTLQELVLEQGSKLEQFVVHHRDRFKALEEKVDKLDGDFSQDSKTLANVIQKQEMRQPGSTASPLSSAGPEFWRDTKSGLRVPVLSNRHKLADFTSGESKSVPSIGRFLRGIVLGGRADDARELSEERKDLSIDSDPSGGYTVSGALAAEWIDLLRARMVLAQAGISTVPMDSKTLTLAKLTADPTATWHGENDALADSSPSFGSVTLDSKSVVALAKLSLELGQDSYNVESILQSALTTALASAIDSAGLQGSSTDAARAPQGLLNYSGINSVAGIGTPDSWDFLLDGIGELMADNVSLENVGALVGPVSLWKTMAKAKTGISSDNSPLPEPPGIARIPRLWTTALPSSTAIVGDWRSYLFGIRQSVQVRILDQAYLGSNLQIAVLAYARCDFQPTREADFCSLQDITV